MYSIQELKKKFAPACDIIRYNGGYFCNTHGRYIYKYKWKSSAWDNFKSHYWRYYK